MRAEEFTELLRKRPFAPLRLHMTNGKAWDINQPNTVLVLRDRVDIGIQPDPATGVVERVAHCSLLDIARVEELPPSTRAGAASADPGSG